MPVNSWQYGQYAGHTQPNAWVTYDSYLDFKSPKPVQYKYKRLMAGYIQSMPVGICNVDFRMTFFYNLEDAAESGKWDYERLENHFEVEKEEMAFSSEW